MAAITIDMRRLERSLAFEHASSIIETNCAPAITFDDAMEDVYDIDDCCEGTAEVVEESVSYLSWRGCIVRDPSRRNHVMILDEDEAQEKQESDNGSR